MQHLKSAWISVRGRDVAHDSPIRFRDRLAVQASHPRPHVQYVADGTRWDIRGERGDAHCLVGGGNTLVRGSAATEELDGLGVAALNDQGHESVAKEAANAEKGHNDFVAVVVSGKVCDDDRYGHLEVPTRVQQHKISVENFLGLALLKDKRSEGEHPKIQEQVCVETENREARP
jgi:hypothetical protein